MRTWLLRLAAVFLPALLLNCSDSTEPVENIDYSQIPTGQISYSQHVQVILNKYQGILQEDGNLPPGLKMDSWDNLILGWERGEVVIPFDAGNSLLLELTTKLQGAATQTAEPLEADELDLLRRWIDDGAKNDKGEVPYANSQNRLYVCAQGEAIIHVIDVNAMLVIRNIHLTKLGFPASANPHHIAFSPDGNYFFVSCINSQVNRVLKFETATDQWVGEAETFIPALLDHHPTENELYVSRFMLDYTTTSIHVLNSVTMEPADTGNKGDIILPGNLTIAHAMALDRTGKYAFTASFAQDEFLVIKHSSKEFVNAVPLGTDRIPLQVTVSPDNTRAYISCIGTGEIVIIDIRAPETVSTVESAIEIGGQPWHGVFNSDGSRFYVANLELNNLTVINTAAGSFETVGAGDGSDGLSMPHGIAISGDDRYVFVSNRNTNGNYRPYYELGDNMGDNSRTGTVVVVNAADLSIVKIIEIEDFGSGMRMYPN